MQDLENTQYFKVEVEPENGVKMILSEVYEALSEKGYDPVSQIVGYIMSGDPTYITRGTTRRSGMRVMGLDFGSKTVGVAISDPLFVTAQGIEIIRRKEENKLRHTLQRIEELIGEYEVGQIVLGLPKNMNATEGERVEKTKEFADKLARRTGLPVAFMDERLTTVAADRTMMEVGVRRENRKEYVDMIAAVLILQEYLDRQRMQTENGQEN